MIQKRRKLLNSIYEQVVSGISSKFFFYAIALIAALQALWYIFIMAPSLFDEGEHYGFISVYSHRISPFITHQPTSMDYLGDVMREPSYLYYYLMSWPLRVFQLFTHDSSIQIVLLRFVGLAFFLCGLFVYRKLLLQAGVSKVVTNIGLLFFVLTPSIAPLAGAVNYDSAIFLVAGLLLLQALKIIQKHSVDFRDLSIFFILGFLGCLVQFEYIALFVPTALYVVYDIWKKYGFKKSFSGIKDSYRRVLPWQRVVLVGLLVISLGLFIERPVYNVVRYGAVTPQCDILLTKERCMKNYTEARNILAIEHKSPTFIPANPFQYTLGTWIPGMLKSDAEVLPWNPIRAVALLYYCAALFGAVLILIYLRDFLKRPGFKMLLFVTASYAILLDAYLYKAYANLGGAAAVTSRYLLLVQPFFMCFAAMGLIRLFSNYRKLLLTGGILLLIVFITQGGGIGTGILTASPNYFWHRSYAHTINQDLYNILKPLTVTTNA